MKKKIFIFFGLLIIGYSLFAQHSGDLDSTFGIGGKVSTSIGSYADYGQAVATQSDGKIIIAGRTWNGLNYDFALVRYNINGGLDSTFGAAGKVTTDFENYNDWGSSIAIQADGKIIVSGFTYSGINNIFATVRYNMDGSLDNSFGTTGKVTTVIGGYSEAYSIAIQADGKIIVAGLSTNTSNDFALVRYNINGSLDSSFGIGGIVTSDFGNLDDNGQSVTIQTDGKIIVTGYSGSYPNYDFALVRYNTNGSLDSTFGTAGKVTTTIGSSGSNAHSVTLQSDGKIIIAGLSIIANRDFALVRYNTDGSLDNSFGLGGIVTTTIGNSDDVGYSIAIQSNDKLIVAGFSNISSSGIKWNFALIRYNNNGSIDTTFGNSGTVTTDFGGSDNYGLSVKIQPDNKILVAGYLYNYNESKYKFALARYFGRLTDIEEIADKIEIKIYPNPVQKNILIDVFENMRVNEFLCEIINTQGQVIISSKLVNQKTEINLSKLSSGFFLVKISTANKMIIEKIIKE